MVGLPTGRRAFWRDKALRKTNPDREVLSTESQQVAFSEFSTIPAPARPTWPPARPHTTTKLSFDSFDADVLFPNSSRDVFSPKLPQPHTSWDIVWSPPRSELSSEMQLPRSEQCSALPYTQAGLEVNPTTTTLPQTHTILSHSCFLWQATAKPTASPGGQELLALLTSRVCCAWCCSMAGKRK